MPMRLTSHVFRPMFRYEDAPYRVLSLLYICTSSVIQPALWILSPGKCYGEMQKWTRWIGSLRCLFDAEYVHSAFSLCRKVPGEPNKQKSPVNKCWPEGPESRIVLRMVLTRLPSIVPCLSTITTGHSMHLAKNRVHGIEAGCFWSDYNSHPSQTEWWHGYISAVIFGPNFHTQRFPPETDERIDAEDERQRENQAASQPVS